MSIYKLCGILIVLLLLIDSSSAKKLPDLRDLDLSSWGCLEKPDGTARGKSGKLRNRMKNRQWKAVQPGVSLNWTFDDFIKNTRAYDTELGDLPRDYLPPKKAKRLAAIESQIVSVTGWIVLVYPGPPESCNCESVIYHDWHVELLRKPLAHAPGIGDPTAIVCEVTPRSEGHLYRSGVRLVDLAAYMRLGFPPFMKTYPTGNGPSKVRITGYLMWDDAHASATNDVGEKMESKSKEGYLRPWRASAWEIHPILKIERVN